MKKLEITAMMVWMVCDGRGMKKATQNIEKRIESATGKGLREEPVRNNVKIIGRSKSNNLKGEGSRRSLDKNDNDCWMVSYRQAMG